MAARRSLLWRLLVPAVALFAGLLLATSAETAQGTDLRSGGSMQLDQLVVQRNAQLSGQTRSLARLRARVDAQAKAQAGGNAGVRAAQRRAQQLTPAAGLQAQTGPGLTVTLADAPRAADGQLPAGAGPDDVVVHQQDVQAVVNALWAGGAEAMQLMDQRVISTSAVRCVGNTLLLQGRVYSPPFTVTAIGNAATMEAALGREPGVVLFGAYADAYGLTYDEQRKAAVTVPAYAGTLNLDFARGGAG